MIKGTPADHSATPIPSDPGNSALNGDHRDSRLAVAHSPAEALGKCQGGQSGLRQQGGGGGVGGLGGGGGSGVGGGGVRLSSLTRPLSVH